MENGLVSLLVSLLQMAALEQICEVQVSVRDWAESAAIMIVMLDSRAINMHGALHRMRTKIFAPRDLQR